MKLQFDCKKRINLIGLNSAIKATSIKEFIGVSTFGEKLLVQLSAPINDVQIGVISELVIFYLNTHNWDLARRQRQSLFDEVDWRIQRALDEGENTTQLIEYRRALRDITKQESPDTVVWPTKPW